MAEAVRFDQPVTIAFGGEDLVVAPLKGLERIRAFERALVEEINSLDGRVREHARLNRPVSAEALMEAGVDEARLLKAGLPDLMTDAKIEESTAKERMGVLTAICFVNNLGRFAPFLALEALIEVAQKMNQRLPEFPMPVSNGSSSEPVSAGETSSAS